MPPSSSRTACAIRRATWPSSAPSRWTCRSCSAPPRPRWRAWHHAQTGRYRSAATHASGPSPRPCRTVVRIVDTRPRRSCSDGLCASSCSTAIDARLERGEQSLIFLNRRGYAPVLACTACGWISRCKRCAANMVAAPHGSPPALPPLRLRGRVFRKACPECGNQDIHPFGRGTQRLEETLLTSASGAPVFCALTATRPARRSSGRRCWRQIHAGEADIPDWHPDAGQGSRLSTPDAGRHARCRRAPCSPPTSARRSGFSPS
jgi:primosomal protein N' (replication factor Y)